MAFTEDLTNFFSTDDFAQTATVGANTFPVILDSPSVEVFDGAFEARQYRALAIEANVTAASVVQGTSIVIGGTTYKVREFMADGTGLMELRLEKQ